VNDRKWIFSAVIGVVFLFAGYNLYSYFQNQAAVAVEEERVAAERKIEREQQAAAREQARIEEQTLLDAEQAAQDAAEEQRVAEENRAREEAILAEEVENQERTRRADEDQLQRTLARAREVRSYEGIQTENIQRLRSLSPRYILDHPDEFLPQRFSAADFGNPPSSSTTVLFEDSTPLMLYAAISQDTSILQALIDIGLDVNAANKMGVTPLMFAAAYNSPEVVEFLAGQGADVGAVSYIKDINALHFAALLNPNPETAEALVRAGAKLETPTSTGETAIILAASENRNMEVVERLAKLGSDTSVYDENGVDVRRIVEARFNGDREQAFISISPEYQEQVLETLR
jgi:multidrug efflux pump subunit AcrA (membrane-fusion protein)